MSSPLPTRPEDESILYLTTNVVNEMCMEKRVFYRVVSGLHATINIHVAAHYPKPGLLGQEEWGRNVTMFEKFFHPEKTFGEGMLGREVPGLLSSTPTPLPQVPTGLGMYISHI